MVFFLPCLRQVLQNMASLSNASQSVSHKVSHFDWNFLSLLHAGLESVKGLLVSPDGPSNLLLLADSAFKFTLNKNLKI